MVSKSGNIKINRNNLFLINHRLLIKCIFKQIYSHFFTTMICFPVMHMFVFLVLLITCILYIILYYAYLFDQFCLNMAVKFAFWMIKIVKAYWSDVWIIIDYVKYKSSKIKFHFDQFFIIIDDRWNTEFFTDCIFAIWYIIKCDITKMDQWSNEYLV